jgi:SAM-dependent methyltransferase
MHAHTQVDFGESEGAEPVPVSQVQDRVNRRVYWSPEIVQHYKGVLLTTSETAALLRHQPAFVGRDILDLGIGTGRTTRFLAPLARRYVGIDYSQVMVDHVRKTMPEIDVRCGNIRDLSEFAQAEFDFVFGPNSVIDALSHKDRLRSLGEFRRVLRPGGLFVFTAHNRSARESLGGPKLVRSRNPVTQARYVVSYWRSMKNHSKVGRLRRFEEDYALLNDIGHEWACLHYYITREAQAKQLEPFGFRLLDVFADSGALLPAGEDEESANLLYVAARI